MATDTGNKPLNPKHAIFVSEYVKHGNGSAAALAAGYAESNVSTTATLLLKREDVKSAIAVVRKELSVQGVYNLKTAMSEADAAMAFAKETKNANAYVKAVELRSKLSGLMIERHDMKVVGFHVSVAGIDFTKRDGEKAEAEEIEEQEQTDVTDTGEDLLK